MAPTKFQTKPIPHSGISLRKLKPSRTQKPLLRVASKFLKIRPLRGSVK